jgi:hypothetical protein
LQQSDQQIAQRQRVAFEFLRTVPHG